MSQPRRFVILLHQTPKEEHWDVMLETDSALKTWSIPPQCPTGLSFTRPAKRLPDHRKHYLDYEGEVADNRGTLARIDTGLYTQLLSGQYNLFGTHFLGKLTVETGWMVFEKSFREVF